MRPSISIVAAGATLWFLFSTGGSSEGTSQLGRSTFPVPDFPGTRAGQMTFNDRYGAFATPELTLLTPTRGQSLRIPSAAVESVLYDFLGVRDGDGQYPFGGLLADGTGALYGSTAGGEGNVYKLTPNGTIYTESVIHAFQGPPMDGFDPSGNLIGDASTAMYGTTQYGGTSTACTSGCGTVFKLLPKGSGYSESLLYSFLGPPDGERPFGALVADLRGALYGTTEYGGTGKACSGGCGSVFMLKPSGGGYTESILHDFHGYPKDGAYPIAGLAVDSKGALYGTTYGGGSGNAGTVFKLTPTGSTFAYRLLYAFSGGNDGSEPSASLTIGAKGVLYGTTYGGGSGGYGTVFEVTRSGKAYAETVLHNLGVSAGDGAFPLAGVIAGKTAGTLYGTTWFGGKYGSGTVFELIANGSTYTEKVLHSFGQTDGSHPTQLGNLITDHNGALYGATYYGGSGNCTGNISGCGVVFKVTP